MNIQDDILSIKGIGKKTQSLFHRLNIYNIGDLITHYPRAYIRHSKIKTLAEANIDENIGLAGTVQRTESFCSKRGLVIVNAYVADRDNRIFVCSWFNSPYMKNSLRNVGERVFSGRLTEQNGRLSLQQPYVYRVSEYERLIKNLSPIYPLTSGLSNKVLENSIISAISQLDMRESFKEYLTDDIISRNSLMPRYEAYEFIHFPKDYNHLEAIRRRLVFDEFFIFLIKLSVLKKGKVKQINTKKMPLNKLALRVKKALPFDLTKGQRDSLNEIYKDLNSNLPMNRLLQGDVGSGKTIVALLSMLLAYENGYQSTLMAPTEVLAVQHFDFITQMIRDNNLECKAVLLTGNMKSAEKKSAYRLIETGEADLIIGTHALIQEKLLFNNLGLVITDEQHRFGVRQRLQLAEKSECVHTLVMSATPIPRTLAIILYGELDISVIKELPKDRVPIKNAILDETHRMTTYKFMVQQINQGRQCYIVCPMIDESMDIDLHNVVSETAALKSILPKNIRIEMLHGDMKAEDKNNIMQAFKLGKIDILVSTTVIEVGVNVPNATVMLIENADRFGLAQLHQLRGRVGRGAQQSYAMFMSSSDSEMAKKRLFVLKESNDGFYIAQQDLELRGPGELFGIRQSGSLNFKLADIFSDKNLLDAASKEVKNLEKNSPDILDEIIETLGGVEENTGL